MEHERAYMVTSHPETSNLAEACDKLTTFLDTQLRRVQGLQ